MLVGCGGGSSTGALPPSTPPNPGPPPSGSPQFGPPPNIPGNRTNWVRTGSNPISLYYDATRNRLFASLPALNRLDVMEPDTGNIISQIPVSLAGNEPNGVWLASSKNISSSLDGKSLMALGVGYISTIDLASMQVVGKPPLPKALTSWTTPQSVHPTFLVAAAGGRFVMSSWGDFDVFNWDGTSAVASVHIFSDVYSLDRNLDGTKVLIASGDTGGGYELLDVASDTIVKQANYSNATIMTVRPNPVRDEWAIANSNGIDFFDANLNLIATVPAVGDRYWGMTFSPDGKYLYCVVSLGGLPFIITVDASLYSVVRVAPATGTDIAGFLRVPPEFIEQPIAADNSGLVFGLGEKGVVIDDSTYSVDPTKATPGIHAIIAKPDSGALSGSTQVQISTQVYSTLPAVWFGTRIANSESIDNAGQVSVTTPPAKAAGPVNIKIFPPDGYAHMMPQAFTYGTVITSIRNSVCAAAGGCSADIFGFGLSGNISQTTVKIGDNTAPVQAINYFDSNRPYPYSLEYLTVTVPPGVPGRADVTVITPIGSATLPGGLLYAKSVQRFPSSQRYNALLYDKSRQLLYASTDSSIVRYSVSTGTFLSPITPPRLTTQSQFQGLALTPDGSKLLAANQMDVSVAVIDPDNPTNAIAIPVPVPANTSGPQFLAATSTGKAIISMGRVTAEPAPGPLFVLDLGTMQIKASTDPNVSTLGDPLPVSGTSDGSMVMVGTTLMWSAVTDAFTLFDAAGPGGAMTGAAGDGNLFAAGPVLVDRDLNSTVGWGIPDEIAILFNISQQMDIALNNSGSLWFLPYADHLAILDSLHGAVIRDISLQNRLNLWTKVIAVDDTAQHIFLSDVQGLTVYEFLAAPLAIGSVTPSVVSSTGSSLVKIRGSGFQAGTTVTVSGKTASAILVDPNTLQVTMPANPVGPAQMVLQNPDGDSYRLDAAVVYQ